MRTLNHFHITAIIRPVEFETVSPLNESYGRTTEDLLEFMKYSSCEQLSRLHKPSTPAVGVTYSSENFLPRIILGTSFHGTIVKLLVCAKD